MEGAGEVDSAAGVDAAVGAADGKVNTVAGEVAAEVAVVGAKNAVAGAAGEVAAVTRSEAAGVVDPVAGAEGAGDGVELSVSIAGSAGAPKKGKMDGGATGICWSGAVEKRPKQKQ